MKECNQCGVVKKDDTSYCQNCGEHNNFKIVPPYDEIDKLELEKELFRQCRLNILDDELDARLFGSGNCG